MNDHQIEFLHALKIIKDIEVDLSESFLNNPRNSSLNKEYMLLKQKLTSEEDITAFRNVQNELAETVIYRIMEMIDGYGDLPYKVDLIDKDSNDSLKSNIQLHDQFINYISSEDNDD
ncbi:hypothetical protein [Gottfriedia luciferensis]|uniref:hypothetical protein n=1 Tax=Gottfriedia luciferensis TaxID=178774 RepID=UPI000B4437CB|nr:hypothetical protein [Gottfriedia luciferensis]